MSGLRPGRASDPRTSRCNRGGELLVSGAVHREIRELDRRDLLRPPSGSVAPWVRAVIGVAALTVVGVAAVGARAVWRVAGPATGIDGAWFRNGLAVAIVTAIAAVFLPRARISRFVRLAALLPVIVLAGMIAAWVAWDRIAPAMPYLRRNAPLLLDAPVGAVLGAMAGAIVLAPFVVRPRRRDGIRAAVVIALVNLLVLGLWLPLASVWWGNREGIGEIGRGFAIGSTPGLLTLVLGPPLAIATAFASFVLRQPDRARRGRGVWTIALWLVIPIAVVSRIGASSAQQLVYLNLLHFLVASAFVAAAALAAFVASLGLRGWSARRRLAREGAVTGVIPDDDDDPRGVVACLELEGWTSGPRPLVDAFEVATPAGRILVPVGAELAAAVPEGSSILYPGESVAVIRRGDRVVVGGLVEPEPDHPFRGASALVAGPAGVVVRRLDDNGGGFASIALVAWRPCVAFLMILTAVALPGLAAALSGF